MEIVKVIEEQGFLCFILKKDNDVYISFRGTTNFDNVKSDLDVRRLKLPDGSKVHNGFYTGADLLFNEIRKYIKPYNNIYTASHSLGSSINVLVCDLLWEKGYNIKRSVMFECPNFCDKKYLKNRSEYGYNRVFICNNLDGVTMIPLFLTKFRRDTIYFDRNEVAYLNPSKLNVITDRILTVCKNPMNLTELWTDHGMEVLLNICYRNKDLINGYIQEGVI